MATYTLKHYTRLGAPINRLGFSNQIYAAYGGVSFLVIIAAAFIALSAIMFGTYVIALIENPQTEASADNWLNKITKKAGRKLSRRHARTKQFLLATILTVFLAAILYGLWKFTVSSAVERAEKRAFDFATTCTESVISLNNTDHIHVGNVRRLLRTQQDGVYRFLDYIHKQAEQCGVLAAPLKNKSSDAK